MEPRAKAMPGYDVFLLNSISPINYQIKAHQILSLAIYNSIPHNDILLSTRSTIKSAIHLNIVQRNPGTLGESRLTGTARVFEAGEKKNRVPSSHGR